MTYSIEMQIVAAADVPEEEIAQLADQCRRTMEATGRTPWFCGPCTQIAAGRKRCGQPFSSIVVTVRRGHLGLVRTAATGRA